jgi:hypothetical protein
MVFCLDDKRAEIKKGTQFVSAFGLTVLIFQQTNNLLSPKGDTLLLRSRQLKRRMVWRKIVSVQIGYQLASMLSACHEQADED